MANAFGQAHYEPSLDAYEARELQISNHRNNEGTEAKWKRNCSAEPNPPE